MCPNIFRIIRSEQTQLNRLFFFLDSKVLCSFMSSGKQSQDGIVCAGDLAQGHLGRMKGGAKE